MKLRIFSLISFKYPVFFLIEVLLKIYINSLIWREFDIFILKNSEFAQLETSQLFLKVKTIFLGIVFFSM